MHSRLHGLFDLRVGSGTVVILVLAFQVSSLRKLDACRCGKLIAQTLKDGNNIFGFAREAPRTLEWFLDVRERTDDGERCQIFVEWQDLALIAQQYGRSLSREASECATLRCFQNCIGARYIDVGMFKKAKSNLRFEDGPN